MPNDRGFIYLLNKIDITSFNKKCADNKVDPKKVVFIFPGNKDHHSHKNLAKGLFEIKNGSGLAGVAAQLSEKEKCPTLSLPTTTMENWTSEESKKDFVQRAIADLYEAVGMGYSLALPVREHEPNAETKYFPKPLASTNFEPNFWGGIQKAPNTDLAEHYTTELDKLQMFLNLTDEEQHKHALENIDNQFYSAFIKGYNQRKQVETKATSLSASVPQNNTDASLVRSVPGAAPAVAPASIRRHSNHCVTLSEANLPVPQIEVTMPDEQLKSTIPITDHPPMIQNVKIGEQEIAVGTYNVWNPGSPIAPGVVKALGRTDSFSLKNVTDQESHMKATAQYIYSQFKAGVALLSLQEIPTPSTLQFKTLEDELTRLAAQDQDRPPIINVSDLKRCFAKTKKLLKNGEDDGYHPFGTSILYNPSIFKVEKKDSHILSERGQTFNVTPLDSASESFEVAVIHGDYDRHNDTIKYINSFKKGLILGDSNIQNKDLNGLSGNARDSIDAPNLTINNKPVQLNTVDVVIDRISPLDYSPNRNAIARPPVSVGVNAVVPIPLLTPTFSSTRPKETNQTARPETTPSRLTIISGSSTSPALNQSPSPHTIISGRSNNASESMLGQSNRGSLPDIYIYAEVVSATLKPPQQSYARKPYKLDDKDKDSLLNNKNGLEVCAPGGMPYQFSYANETPVAKIGPQTANVDNNALAITIISMIDNVLVKGSVVNVDTDNPMIAEIAHNYFSHLNKTKNIVTSGFTIKHNGQVYAQASTPMVPGLSKIMQSIDTDEGKLGYSANKWSDEIKKYHPNKPQQDITTQLREQVVEHRSHVVGEEGQSSNIDPIEGIRSNPINK